MSKKPDQSNSPIFEQQRTKAKKTNDLTSQLLRQANYRKQIQQIHERDKKQKAQRVFKKSSIKQYRQEDQDDYDVPVDGELERGSRIFMQHCSTCHSLQPFSKDSMRGPALGLVFNRKIGSDTDYEGYSDQMIKRMGYWSAGNLYKFMYNPQQFMKGTMCFPANCGIGIQSEQDRADLIYFLKEYCYQLTKNMKIKQAKRTSYSYMQSQLYADEEMEKIRLQNINTDRK